jgi:hypothetical protein
MTTTNGRPTLTQPDQMPTPVVDDLSATVLDEAIDTLAELRTPYWLGDSAVRLHAWQAFSNKARRSCPPSWPKPATRT